MPPAVSKNHVKVKILLSSLITRDRYPSIILICIYHLNSSFQSELLEALDEDDLPGFTTQVKVAQEIGSNFEELYGVESGNKTILHLALEEDDGLPYCEELIQVTKALHAFIIILI